MQTFGVGSVTFFIGLAITVGAWLALMAVLVRYDLHKSWAFRKGITRLFEPDAKQDRKRALVRGLVMGVGFVVLFLSLMIGDSQRNRPCRDACRQAGFETGLFRGSPHETVNGRAAGPYQCWCRRGDAWSDSPADLAPR